MTITKEARAELRARCVEECSFYAFGLTHRIPPNEVLALLNALDAAEAENERLRATWTAPNGKVWSPLSANASGLLHMAERKWRRKAEDAEATIARLTDALETIDCHATIDMKPEVRAAIDKWRAGRKGGQ